MPDQAGSNRLLSRVPVVFWAVTVLVAILDLITKSLAFRRLPDLESAPIVLVRGFLQIVHSENRGGVFGLGQGSAAWLLFAAVAAVAVIWFAHRRDSRPLLIQLALGLILAGALGNLYDRIAFGYVRDFIDVVYWPGRHWPAFNAADSGICIGAVCLAIYALFLAPKPAPKPDKKSGRR